MEAALLSAFPRREDLRRFILHALSLHLDQIAGGSTDADVATSLLTWAEANGRTEDLILLARLEVSGNQALQRVAEELFAGTGNRHPKFPPSPPPGTPVPPTSGEEETPRPPLTVSRHLPVLNAPDEQPTEAAGRVFLSYSHEDKPFVHMMAADIAASGVDLWLDDVELGVGDSLVVRISDAIQSAPSVVAFLSPVSIRSSWVQRELAIAMTLEIGNQHIVVLPALIGQIEPQNIPALLIGKLYLDFRRPENYDASLGRLLKVLVPARTPAPAEFLDQLEQPIIPFDAARHQRLARIAKASGMRSWVMAYLQAALQREPDPTSRYWMYVTLGSIGGPDARQIIEAGVGDPNAFAQTGREDALQILDQST